MSKIVLYGGAFDPVTNAHIAVIKQAIKLRNPETGLHLYDEAWIQPCYQHMFGKDMVDADLRKRMCLETVTNMCLGKVFVSDFEIANKLILPTYSILKKMQEHFTGCEFTLLIGGDNLDKIHKWIDYEKIITEFKILVTHRQQATNGGLVIPNLPFKELRILPDAYLEPLSSTDTRNMYLSGQLERAAQFTPAPAHKIIVENGLYGARI